jgi:hypothetical protein
LEQLIEQVRARLARNAYANEAQVSMQIVLPTLRALGWDDSDPGEVIPEYASGRGRVDFALCSGPRRATVFIEVKGVGRSVEGDRQLFEYAFHEGVPLCLLTDGRDWSFYLPSAQGSYDDRRVYRLLIDERPAAECSRVLNRYLARDRVRSGLAYEDAQRDYRDAAKRRDATRALPQAWTELLSIPDELIVELLADRAEALCGVRPGEDELRAFLRTKADGSLVPASQRPKPPAPAVPTSMPLARPEPSPVLPGTVEPARSGRGIGYTLLGQQHTAPNANSALVAVLTTLCARDPSRIPLLADAVRGRSRNHIAQSTPEIYPARPDLARAAEIGPGWLVGLNISNRHKRVILIAACEVFGLVWGSDLQIELPNENA